MSVPRPNLHVSRHTWRIIAAIELLLIGAVIGLGVASYIQNERQGKLCQLVEFAHGQVQRGISTNSTFILYDVRHPTKANIADESTRRQSISDATTALISINHARC